MTDVIAGLPAEELTGWEEQIRTEARRHDPPVYRGAPAFDPFRPVAAVRSDPEDAIGLVRRGVRVAPFAETTPLLPLYAALDTPLPAHLRVAHEELGYEFLLVQLTFSLRLEDDEAPDHAELAVRIDDGLEGARATRAIEVFPQRIHATWFRAQAELSVALDTSLKFSVGPVPTAGGAASANASGDASAKLLAGPFHIDIGRTELEVIGEGDREIGWVYRVQSALEGKNDFRSFLVLKLARETEKVNLLAKIGVRTYRRSWRTLWLREKLPILYADAALALELPRRSAQSSA